MAKFRFKKADIGIFNRNADHALEGFEKQCRLLGLTHGKFSLIDLVHSTLKKTGPAHVICTTWSAGIKDIHQVKWMYDTDLIQSFRIITSRSYKTRQNNYAVALDDFFGEESIRATDVHAKFILIFNDDYKVCIRSSMNLNANKTCENFEIDEDIDIFNYYMSFVETIFLVGQPGFAKNRFEAAKPLKYFFQKDRPEVKRENRESIFFGHG